MQKLFHLILVIILFLFPFPALSFTSAATKDISTLCHDKSIILLGEQHKQPDSQKLFLDLVQYYVQQGNKVFVGLEIPADKQKKLDKALSGGGDFSFLYPTIDHPAYREMIRTLGKMNGNITVKAIDACDYESDRDKAMSRNLCPALSSGKYDNILVLLGNNHTIKNIKWDEELADQKKKYLAGYLIAGGIELCSVRQLFRDSSESDLVLVVNGSDRFSGLAMEAIQWINHSSDMTGPDVCDGVVEWR